MSIQLGLMGRREQTMRDGGHSTGPSMDSGSKGESRCEWARDSMEERVRPLLASLAATENGANRTFTSHNTDTRFPA